MDYSQVSRHIFRTRVLIGARVTRELADRVKEAAQAENRSVYAWLREAICEKLGGEKRMPPPPSGSPR